MLKLHGNVFETALRRKIIIIIIIITIIIISCNSNAWKCRYSSEIAVSDMSTVILLNTFKTTTPLVDATVNKKAVLSQRWPRDAPYTRIPWRISGVPSYAHGYTFPEIVNGLLL